MRHFWLTEIYRTYTDIIGIFSKFRHGGLCGKGNPRLMR